MQIIDTHQHLWDLDKLRLPWLESAPHINHSFEMKDYLEAIQDVNVVKSVYMEVDVDPRDLVTEAEYVIELCGRDDNPMTGAVIGGQPGTDGFASYINRFKQSPCVKGVRHIVDDLKSFRGEQFIRDIRLLGELGLSFDLCTPWTELPESARLVDQCPDTRFILDHCGNADPKAFDADSTRQTEVDQWRHGITELAGRKNVVCKISGIVALAPKETWTPDDLAPIIDFCIDAFGPDRVMFASDWPVCTAAAALRQWVEALQQIVSSRGETFAQKLFHDNAAAFYGLA